MLSPFCLGLNVLNIPTAAVLHLLLSHRRGVTWIGKLSPSSGHYVIRSQWNQWGLLRLKVDYYTVSLHSSARITSDNAASQITCVSIVCITVCSGADKRKKHQSSASMAFVRGIHRRPMNSPHKGPVTRQMCPFDDVIMPCLAFDRAWYCDAACGWIPVSASANKR